jgi:hypothetical protein
MTRLSTVTTPSSATQNSEAPITFCYVTDPGKPDKRSQYKTLKAAQAKAQKLVGESPKLDPDGYAVDRKTGNCLFFNGVTFEELFPK